MYFIQIKPTLNPLFPNDLGLVTINKSNKKLDGIVFISQINKYENVLSHMNKNNKLPVLLVLFSSGKNFKQRL